MEDQLLDEVTRQSKLLETLEHVEAFQIWRKEICDPIIEQLDMVIANSDALSEPILRAKVQLRYLVKDMFYGVFTRVKIANDQERELDKQEKEANKQ